VVVVNYLKDWNHRTKSRLAAFLFLTDEEDVLQFILCQELPQQHCLPLWVCIVASHPQQLKPEIISLFVSAPELAGQAHSCAGLHPLYKTTTTGKPTDPMALVQQLVLDHLRFMLSVV